MVSLKEDFQSVEGSYGSLGLSNVRQMIEGKKKKKGYALFRLRTRPLSLT
jgi:hypothetical protein